MPGRVVVRVRARNRARAPSTRVYHQVGLCGGGSGAESPFREAAYRSGWTVGPNCSLTARTAPSGRTARARRVAPEVRQSSTESARNPVERSETRINSRECRPPSWLRRGYSVLSRKKCQAISGYSRDPLEATFFLEEISLLVLLLYLSPLSRFLPLALRVAVAESSNIGRERVVSEGKSMPRHRCTGVSWIS